MTKLVIDTDLYIDLIRTGQFLPVINVLYEKETPGIHFSSIVAQELLAGARSSKTRTYVRWLVEPFERKGRIITPTHRDWKTAGDILAVLLMRHPSIKKKLRTMVNDCLLAMSARSKGATVYTRNREDFGLILSVHNFDLVVVA